MTHAWNHVGAVLLCAGKGTRLGMTDKPKVMLALAGKPMVAYAVETLESLGFPPERIVLVVGFQKETVQDYFGNRVTYAVQHRQDGTAHAAYVGMEVLPKSVSQVLVMGGDDAAFYTVPTLQDFIERHVHAQATLSLLTVTLEDPSQMGRIVRDKNNELMGILEKEQVHGRDESAIREVSTGTFCLDRAWFEHMYPFGPKLSGLKEYALPTAVALAYEAKENIQAILLNDPNEWWGVNTPEDLKEAEQRMKKKLGEA